jgi:hypothetical protein
MKLYSTHTGARSGYDPGLSRLKYDENRFWLQYWFPYTTYLPNIGFNMQFPYATYLPNIGFNMQFPYAGVLRDIGSNVLFP